ncbi:hypothetical protein HHK36_030312 [Tetracentron sinense]|uniref:PRONE domain-containing protein n=1 Tax=Tetracentron sinense TaxID=13715 RepID=A0A834Y7D3_TETSI|nr:hypothetical protein HHK36_030312 [Tetracentron sinense]
MRRLACCSRHKEISLDFDERDHGNLSGIMTYNGLEGCILNSLSYDNESGTSRVDGCATDSLNEDDLSRSSSKNIFGSFSPQLLMNRRYKDSPDEWKEVPKIPQHFYAKEKPACNIQFSEVETMKERFAKLLLGEDVTGGCKGLSTALALSNAIMNLAVTVFGELWKLEPLPDERRNKWRREMDWLLSPANYMVELVPAKQNGANGWTLEIMTPKTRPDIHMNLPALQKLDSMLIEMLDSMVNTEFWYADGGSRAEGRSKIMRQSKRWWFPSPRVPKAGLSFPERKKLLYQAKVVHQVFKAAKSINDNILLEIPVPTVIKDSLPKSGKASLGEKLHRILTAELSSVEEMLDSLNLKSEHHALETINRLEAAIFSWKERISEQASGKSPLQNSWSFVRDPFSELDKMEVLSDRAETLLQMLKIRYPNLPQTFLVVTKIQYNKDVGHSILEAYSRVLASLAVRIVSRMEDILQEDVLSNPNSPIATCCFPRLYVSGISETPAVRGWTRHSLIDQMNRVDGRFCDFNASKASDVEIVGREACSSVSPTNSH